MEQDKPDSFDKPGYDGRINYHNLLKQYMIAIAEASYMDDFSSWSKLLRDMYGLVRPFIKVSDAELSRIEIEKCESYVNISKTCIMKTNEIAMLSIVRNRLSVARDNLYDRSKHLLLPTKSDAEESFDAESFMKGSDL